MSELIKATETWPLQDAYKQQLHERIQRWGECIAEHLATSEDDKDKEEKVAFFQYLMESVLRHDKLTAQLLQDLDGSAVESTRSWYSDQLGSPNSPVANSARIRHFNGLFQLSRRDK